MVILGLVAIGAASAFAVCERRERAVLEASQRELQATVERAQRTIQAERARGALTRLALDRTSAEPPASQETPPEESDPAPAEAAPPSPAVYMAHLGSSFAGEAIDSGWSRRAAEVVNSRLAAEGDRSLRSIECHTSMCRLVTEESGPDRAWQQIRAVLGDPAEGVWSGAYFSRVEQGADGRTERVTYLLRSGTTLPSI